MNLEQETSVRVWLGVGATLLLAGALAYFVVREQHAELPPPVPSRAHVARDPSCTYAIARPGESVRVFERARTDDVIVGELPHNTRLDVASVRRDWIEIRGPQAGWIFRRYVREDCP